MFAISNLNHEVKSFVGSFDPKKSAICFTKKYFEFNPVKIERIKHHIIGEKINEHKVLTDRDIYEIFLSMGLKQKPSRDTLMCFRNALLLFPLRDIMEKYLYELSPIVSIHCFLFHYSQLDQKYYSDELNKTTAHAILFEMFGQYSTEKAADVLRALIRRKAFQDWNKVALLSLPAEKPTRSRLIEIIYHYLTQNVEEEEIFSSSRVVYRRKRLPRHLEKLYISNLEYTKSFSEPKILFLDNLNVKNSISRYDWKSMETVFRAGEYVWAKTPGQPFWPAKIIETDVEKSDLIFRVVFYNSDFGVKKIRGLVNMALFRDLDPCEATTSVKIQAKISRAMDEIDRERAAASAQSAIHAGDQEGEASAPGTAPEMALTVLFEPATDHAT